jgi:hypothetical protein
MTCGIAQAIRPPRSPAAAGASHPGSFVLLKRRGADLMQWKKTMPTAAQRRARPA